MDRIAAWLRGLGFAIEYMARTRTFVAFSGTAEQVRATVQTAIHRYLQDGKTHFANSSAPSIPSALVGVVAGIRGLDDFDFYLKPSGSTRPQYIYNGTHALSPDDVAAIYDINALYEEGITGAGQTIAIAGEATISDNPQGVASSTESSTADFRPCRKSLASD